MLTLHYHPLSSYCQKALIGLYELGVDFDKNLVDLGDPSARAAFLALWPIGKFPLLEERATGRVIPESSILLEHVDRGVLLPADGTLEVRLLDRFFDQYIHAPMQRLVADRLRPVDGKDPLGVAAAHAQLQTAYAYLDARLLATWAAGERFTLADCAAAPALFYANECQPFAAFPRLVAYFDRLSVRPSVARARTEAEPYLDMFPR